ncbi:hypothetical protein EYF80_060093 [Liparis tanakae]|uniref:Uncharacterized protein n=1 Tax=Liparis tanakae TaxID=230148 RepID=A0A4Z2ELC0_9TELE|nr:hypothetical protein EYF80_060093 [Liparis tanakae]
MTPAPSPPGARGPARLGLGPDPGPRERGPRAFFTNGPLKPPVSMTKGRERYPPPPRSAKKAGQWSGCSFSWGQTALHWAVTLF